MEPGLGERLGGVSELLLLRHSGDLLPIADPGVQPRAELGKVHRRRQGIGGPKGQGRGRSVTIGCREENDPGRYSSGPGGWSRKEIGKGAPPRYRSG